MDELHSMIATIWRKVLNLDLPQDEKNTLFDDAALESAMHLEQFSNTQGIFIERLSLIKGYVVVLCSDWTYEVYRAFGKGEVPVLK